MRAVAYQQYGAPEVLQLTNLDLSVPGPMGASFEVAVAMAEGLLTTLALLGGSMRSVRAA